MADGLLLDDVVGQLTLRSSLRSTLPGVTEEPEELAPDADNLPVLADVRVIEPQAPNPLIPAAAVAATSFVAGAATIAVIRRQRSKPSRRQRRKERRGPAQLVEVVSSRSFLVDVHLINRDGG